MSRLIRFNIFVTCTAFIERQHGEDATEHYIYFFADRPTPEDEEATFAGLGSILRARAHTLSISIQNMNERSGRTSEQNILEQQLRRRCTPGASGANSS